MTQAQANRRVLVALRAGPAIETLVSYASGVPNTRATLRLLETQGLVRRVGTRDTWGLTESGEELAK